MAIWWHFRRMKWSKNTGYLPRDIAVTTFYHIAWNVFFLWIFNHIVYRVMAAIFYSSCVFFHRYKTLMGFHTINSMHTRKLFIFSPSLTRHQILSPNMFQTLDIRFKIYFTFTDLINFGYKSESKKPTTYSIQVVTKKKTTNSRCICISSFPTAVVFIPSWPSQRAQSSQRLNLKCKYIL